MIMAMLTLYSSAVQLELVSVPLLFSGEVSLIPARITFSMIGKFGISGTFAVVALYTPEIFPTTLRSQPIPANAIAEKIRLAGRHNHSRT